MRPEISIIGDLVVFRGGELVEIAPRQRKLLAILAGAFGAPLTVDRVVDAMWGEDPPGDPRSSLRFHMSKLRSALEPGVPSDESAIKTTPSGYQMAPDEHLVDAWRLRLDARALFPAQERELEERLVLAHRYVESFNHLLEEFALEEFAQDIRRRWDADVVDGILGFTDQLFSASRYADAITLLTPLNIADPYDEGLASKLVIALSEEGRRVDAVRLFDETHARLAEVGLDPGQELRSTLGEVMSAPVTVVETEVPRRPTPTRLTGREDDLRHLESLVASERVVRIAGLPGVGKTALAASMAAPEDRPVLWVSASDAAHVPSILADVLERTYSVVVDSDNAMRSAGELGAIVVLDGLLASERMDALVASMLASGVTVVVVGTELSLNHSVITLEPLNPKATMDLYARMTRNASGNADEQWLANATGGIPALIAVAAAWTNSDPAEVAETILMTATGDLLSEAFSRLPSAARRVLEGLSMFTGPVPLSDATAFDESGDPGLLLDLIREGWVVSAEGGVMAPSAIRRHVAQDASASSSARGNHARVVLGWPLAKMLRRSADTARAVNHLSSVSPTAARELFHAVAPDLWSAGRFNEIASMASDVVGHGSHSAEPTHRSLYFGAYAALQTGSPEFATRCLDELMSLEPLGPRTLLLAGDVAWFRGDVSESAARFEDARQAAEGEPAVSGIALFGKALVSAHTGDVGGLAESVQELAAIGVGPARWLNAEARGLMHVLEGNHRAAAVEFEEGMAALPLVDRRAAYRRTLDAHVATGEIDAAERLWDEILAEVEYTRVPLDPPTFFSGALFHDLKGEHASAVDLLHRGARSLRSRPAALWVMMGLTVAHRLSDADSDRARLAAVIGRAHSTTGIRLLEPFVAPDKEFRGPFDAVTAIDEILATQAPTA